MLLNHSCLFMDVSFTVLQCCSPRDVVIIFIQSEKSPFINSFFQQWCVLTQESFRILPFEKLASVRDVPCQLSLWILNLIIVTSRPHSSEVGSRRSSLTVLMEWKGILAQHIDCPSQSGGWNANHCCSICSERWSVQCVSLYCTLTIPSDFA